MSSTKTVLTSRTLLISLALLLLVSAVHGRKRDLYLYPGLTWGDSPQLLDEKSRKEANQYYDRSRIALEAEDFYTAIHYIKKAIVINPENIEYYVHFGDIYRKRQDFLRAEDKYSQAYLKNPLDKRIIMRLIDVYIRMEKYNQALNGSEYLYTVYKNMGYVHLNQAEIYAKMGRNFKAVRHYKKAAKELPRVEMETVRGQSEYLDPWMAMGELYFKKKEYQKSYQMYSRAIDIKKGLDEKLDESGLKKVSSAKYLIMERFRSIKDIDSYLHDRANKSRFYFYFNHFLAIREKNETKKIQTLIHKAAPYYSNSAEYNFMLGVEQAQIYTNSDRALEYAERSIKLNEYFIGSYLLKGEIYQNRAEFIKAYNAYKKAEYHAPGNPLVLIKFIQLFNMSGDRFLEEEYLKRYLSTPGIRHETRFRFKLARNYYGRGHYMRAYDVVRKFDLKRFEKLQSKRDLQFAFVHFDDRTSMQNYKYFKAIKAHNEHYVFNGQIRVFLQAGKYLNVLKMYDEYLAKNKYVPIYNKKMLLDWYTFYGTSFYPDERKLGKGLRMLIDKYYEDPEKLDLEIKIHLGEYPEMVDSDIKISENSLIEQLNYIMLTGFSYDYPEAKYYIKKLVGLQDRRLVELEMKAQTEGIRGDIYHDLDFIQPEAQTNEHMRKVARYLEVRRKLKFKKLSYFNRYFYIVVEEFRTFFDEKDYWGMEKKIEELKTYFYANFKEDSDRYVLDFNYLNEMLVFINKMNVVANLELKEKYEEADFELQTIYNKYKEKKFFYTFLSDYYFQEEKFYKSYLFARKGTFLFPGSQENHYNLARYFYEIHNPDRGIYYIKKAIKAKNDEEEYYSLYSMLKMQQNHLRDAFRVLEFGRRQTVSSYHLSMKKGELYYRVGNYSRSLIIFKSLISKDNTDFSAYHNAGMACMKLKRYKEALKYFNKALIYGNKSLVSGYYSAHINYRLGNYEAAARVIDHILKKNPHNPYFQSARGMVYEKLMLSGPIKTYKKYRDLSRTAYIHGMQNSRFYEDVYDWCRQRIKYLDQDYIVRRTRQLEASVSHKALSYFSHGAYKVLIGFNNSRLALYDLTTLEEYWSISLDSPVCARISYNGDSFLVATEGGYLYRLRESDGKILRYFQANIRVNRQPLFVDENTWVISSGEGIISVIKDNKVINTILTGSEITTEMAYDRDRLYFGLRNSQFVCHDIYSRKQFWSYKLRHIPEGNVLIDHKNVYFGVNDNYFHALDKMEGKLRYIYDNSSPPTGEHLKLDNNILFHTADGRIRNVDEKGNFYWEYQANRALNTRPSLQSQMAMLPLKDSSIELISTRDGKEKLKVRLESPPVSRPVFVNNDLLSIVTENGLIYSIFINWQ